MKKFFLATYMLAICALPNAKAQSVKIDDSFKSNLNSNVFSVIPVDEGKLILGGSFTKQGVNKNRNGILLIDQNGENIQDFGGKDATFTEDSRSTGTVYSIAKQNLSGEEKYIVTGSFLKMNGSDHRYIVRLTKSGRIDNTFTPPTFDGYILKAFAIEDGKIIVVGNFKHVGKIEQRGIARLNIDGTLDTQFNKGNIGTNDNYATILTAAMDRDGKIIIAGAISSYNNEPVTKIARINRDGSLDKSFIQPEGSLDWIRTVAIDEDGKILIGGDFLSYNGDSSHKYIVRLNPDGSLDDTFKFSAIREYKDFDNSILQIVPFNGMYYIGIDKNISNDTGTLFRLNKSGDLDKEFLSSEQYPDGTVTFIQIEKDGKMYVSGTFTNIMEKHKRYFSRLQLDVKKIPTDKDYMEQGYKMIYHTGFEKMQPGKFDNDIVTIDGIKWKIVNGSIENDPQRTVLEGKRALCLTANNPFNDPENQTRIEMIEDFNEQTGFPDAYSIRSVMSGEDGNLHHKGWKIAFSFDSGKTWGFKGFPSPLKPGLFKDTFPERKTSTTPMRIKIYYDGDSFINGQRFLIDDIQLYNQKKWNFEDPSNFTFVNMYDGYQTANKTIPVKLNLQSLKGLTDPADPFDDGSGIFNSYIQINLDGKKFIDLYKINISDIDPVEPDFILKDLSEGKHTLEAVLMKLDGSEWGPNREALKIEFEVHGTPIEVKGLSELKKQPLGKFYEVTPTKDDENNRLLINYYSVYRSQKYLTDKNESILIDDPCDYNFTKNVVPEKMEYVKKMRGQLLKMDGILMFRLDSPMEIEKTKDEYQYIVKKSTLQEIKQAGEKNESMLYIVPKVSFDKDLFNTPIYGGGSYNLHDDSKSSIKAFILDPEGLVKRVNSPAIPNQPVDMLVIVTKNYITGEQALAPIIWKKSKDTSWASPDEGFGYSTANHNQLDLRAPGYCKALIYNIEGKLVSSLEFSNKTSILLNTGSYVVIMQSGLKSFVAKFIVTR